MLSYISSNTSAQVGDSGREAGEFSENFGDFTISLHLTRPHADVRKLRISSSHSDAFFILKVLTFV